MLPTEFVFVKDVIPTITEDIRYAGAHNFMGRPAAGYNVPHAVLTREAALALKEAADAFHTRGYTLLVYDGYRPQRAVNDFMRWAEDVHDTVAKAEFYPTLEKAALFDLGYIARRSGHSRGSTVDLTLLDASGQPLDMGGEFDWFSPVSGDAAQGLTDAQKANRLLLKQGMMAAGFLPYCEEWWHFRLGDEPYPDTYFDFVIE